MEKLKVALFWVLVSLLPTLAWAAADEVGAADSVPGIAAGAKDGGTGGHMAHDAGK